MREWRGGGRFRDTGTGQNREARENHKLQRRRRCAGNIGEEESGRADSRMNESQRGGRRRWEEVVGGGGPAASLGVAGIGDSACLYQLF